MPNWWLFFLIQEAGTDALLLQHGFLEEGNEPERHGGDDIAFPPCQTVTKKKSYSCSIGNETDIK